MKLRLKEVMKEKGVSGRELASSLDTTPQYVSNIVSGRQSVSIAYLERIAEILGVKLWELFTSPDEVMPRPEVIVQVSYKKQSYLKTTFVDVKTLISSLEEDFNSRKEGNRDKEPED